VGKKGETAVLYPGGAIPARRVIIAGLGKAEAFDVEQARQTAAAAIRRARDLKAHEVATIIHGAGIGSLALPNAAQATAEASLLALYQYDAARAEKSERHEIASLTIVEQDADRLEAISSAVAAAEALAAGVMLARNLANMPPNVATPSYLAEVATGIAADHNLDIVVGGRKWAKKHNMGAFLAVAKGAGEKPKFIVLEHNAEREDLPTIVLVGKGITFDTGGISLKQPPGMGAMKYDMSGAAAVLGTMKAVGMLDLPLHVVGITPCTENMPDADAYHPADVITAGNGKTIEIISTDAEGRLVLADGLVYAARFAPDAVVDLATLTGACVTALGEGVAAGVFSNDEALQEKLVAAGKSTHERVWPLPLYEDYRESIKSDVADMKNSGGRMGGVGTSAIFLREFTDYPWAHVDMAGMMASEKESGYVSRGSLGFGVRLFIDFLRNW
jgi:leucyl aminopeptidase